MNEKDNEAFEKWWMEGFKGMSDRDVIKYRDVGKQTALHSWENACKYKQKELDELRLQYDKLTDWASEYVAENAKLNQEIEKFKGYLEAWGKDE